jgi:hypothetical protein
VVAISALTAVSAFFFSPALTAQTLSDSAVKSPISKLDNQALSSPSATLQGTKGY